MKAKKFSGTGRRKEATASVYLLDGTGNIVINKKPLEKYFSRSVYVKDVKLPLELTSTDKNYDVFVRAKGGGQSGQAEAIRLAIARALVLSNPKFRPALKKAGFLKRDPRVVERKKYGRPKARKRFQFSKR
ncbi:MAG: 30S ribosomal protein S9 [Spirochaetes bacterium]|nr:30S ribosomal protein S9 [Spirochaetota bacterium]